MWSLTTASCLRKGTSKSGPKRTVGQLRRAIEDYKQEIEDRNYFRQQLMLQSGILPSELDREDYFKLLKIQSAKAREDRSINAAEGFKKMNQMFGG